jgi:hypothetical protein
MIGEINITPNSKINSSFSLVIYLVNVFFENTSNAADKINKAKSKKEPVFTNKTKPKSTKPNVSNPNLFLDISAPCKKWSCPEPIWPYGSSILIRLRLNNNGGLHFAP